MNFIRDAWRLSWRTRVIVLVPLVFVGLVYVGLLAWGVVLMVQA